ncbi:hypothetical protein CLF_107904 [Clonorchis sinensis]|uniref:Uncharacterized protein n=1 Tax=Clonorchis sinensis TaxID=79923 RepID=G7YHB4_CLOSI|nr:hypothetical protein CLF_107904 [Clonorchis sinensis]
MGKNCEIEPPEATWGPWTSWSDCIWPEPYEVCYKRPFQQQTRRCLNYKPGQRCIGSQRRQRHAGCDLNSGSPASFTGITSLKRERLRKSAELCELSGKQLQTSINEKVLGEQLLSIEAVDDWSTVGLEDAPFLNLPSALRRGDLQAVNWPRAEDLLFMTLWIYAVLIHIALILLWIYYIHRWRPRKLARSMPIHYRRRTITAQQYRSELVQQLSTVKRYCTGNGHVDEAWQNVKGAMLAAFGSVCPISPIRP